MITRRVALLIGLISLVVATAASSAELSPEAKKAFDEAYRMRQFGQFAQALRAYEQAIQLAPESQDVWLEYTGCLRQCRRLQRAAQAGWRTLELGTEDAGMWGNLGNIFIQAKAWDAAKAAFEKASALSSDRHWSTQNFINLGYREWVDGRNDAAIQSFERALKMDPANGVAVLDLGCVMVTQGKLQEGQAKMKEGFEMLTKEKNQKALKFAKLVLDKVDQDKGLKPPPMQMLTSSEVLPERFLKQPPKGEALKLAIDPMARRFYPVYENRVISFQAPEALLEKVQLPPDSSTPTLVLRPAADNSCELTFIPLPSNRSQAELKASVLQMAESPDKTAVTPKPELIELKSATAEGYACLVTNKDVADQPAAEGQYPHMIQALLKTGQSEILATILMRSNDKKSTDAMIEILKSLSSS